jgi:hypothetical protein
VQTWRAFPEEDIMKANWFIALGLVVAAGCKGPVDEVISDLEGWKSKMCACTDKACTEKVEADFDKWEDTMMKKMKDVKPDDVDDSQKAKFKSLEKEYRACRKKYDAPE